MVDSSWRGQAPHPTLAQRVATMTYPPRRDAYIFFPDFFFEKKIFFKKCSKFSNGAESLPRRRFARATRGSAQTFKILHHQNITALQPSPAPGIEMSPGTWDRFGRRQKRGRQRNRFQILGNQIRMQRNRFPNLGQTGVLKGFYTAKNVVPFSRNRQRIFDSRWSEGCPKRGSGLDVDLAVSPILL